MIEPKISKKYENSQFGESGLLGGRRDGLDGHKHSSHQVREVSGGVRVLGLVLQELNL